VTKLTTFKFDEELHKQLKEIAFREKRDMTAIITELVKEYIKTHGDGNPVYRLEKWLENPEFIVVPALMSSFESIKKWIDIQLERKNYKDLNEIQIKLQEWNELMRRAGYRTH